MELRSLTIGAVLPGLSVIAVGAFLAAVASGYDMGSAFRPGPGFFPLAIGILLIGLGLGVIVERLLLGAGSLPADDDGGGEIEDLAHSWRPLVATAAGLVVFGLCLETVGFIPATVALVVIAAFGEPRRNWLVIGGIAGFMAVFGTVVFVWGLGLPLDPFRSF